MYLNHITLSTGHIARTSRADVAPEVTSALADWLLLIVNSGRAHPLPVPELSHISAQALVQDGGLVVTVFGPLGPHQAGQPHTGPTLPLITMGVAQRSRHGAALWGALVSSFGCAPGISQPSAPWLAVAIHTPAAAHADPLDWLGDFERCIAWTWITRNPALESAS